jgi:hypothetical protein
VNSVGPSGELIWLMADEAGRSAAFGRIEQEGKASFPAPTSNQRYDATVLVQDGRRTRTVILADQDVTFPRVQTIRDEILIVGSRCRWGPDGSTRDNAHVYSRDGQRVRSFLLGDGIGNFGWGGPDGPEPFGAAGLLRADAAGIVQWRYEPPEGLGTIDDCYALNVADDATWAYYYSDPPLVHVGLDESITAWSTESLVLERSRSGKVVFSSSAVIETIALTFRVGYRRWNVGERTPGHPAVSAGRPFRRRAHRRKRIRAPRLRRSSRLLPRSQGDVALTRAHQRGSFASSAASPVHSVPAPYRASLPTCRWM